MEVDPPHKGMLKRKYILVIMVIYLVLLPLIFILDRQVLRFGFSTQNLAYVLFTLILTIGFFYFYLSKFLKVCFIKAEQGNLLQILLYVIMIAVPEEIIFRGIIQGYLQEKILIIFAIF